MVHMMNAEQHHQAAAKPQTKPTDSATVWSTPTITMYWVIILPSHRGQKAKSTYIFVGKLDPNTSEDDLTTFLSDHGITVSSVNYSRERRSGSTHL